MSTNQPGGDPRFGPSETFGSARTPFTGATNVPIPGAVAPGITPGAPSAAADQADGATHAGGFLLAASATTAAPRPQLGAPRWLFPSVLGTIAVLILAVVGIYYVQGQKTKVDRSVYTHTTLSVPDAVLGLTRGIGPGVQSVESQVDIALAASGALDPVSAGYIDTDGNSYALVAAGKRITGPSDLTNVANSAATRFASGIGTAAQTTTIPLSSEPSGLLGGVLRCGPTNVDGIAATFCVAVDQGAVVQMVIADSNTATAAKTAVALRQAVVQRSS